MVLVSPRLSSRMSNAEQRHLSRPASKATMDRIRSLHT
jgi:hypothetical protein